MKRANYIGAPEFFELQQACRAVVDAFGACVYLVGSCIEKRDYRDVDVRCILEDAVFDRMFPGITSNYTYSSMWSLMCCSISKWLSARSGLPVDFQIQRQTQANTEFNGTRQAIGFFIDPDMRVQLGKSND